LRLHDQPALQSAIELAQKLQTWLLPVYIHDDALDDQTPWGFARTSPQRKAWTHMAVHDLAQQLSALNSQLLQVKGNPVEILKALSHHFQETWIVCEDIAAPYEQAHIQQLKDAKLQVQTVWQSTLVRPADCHLMCAKYPINSPPSGNSLSAQLFLYKVHCPLFQRCHLCLIYQHCTQS
jgi:deoxyribodipyrimidine photo-lyase